jgi:hypothetical protein
MHVALPTTYTCVYKQTPRIVDQQQIHRKAWAEARLVGSGIICHGEARGAILVLEGVDHKCHYCGIVI